MRGVGTRAASLRGEPRKPARFAVAASRSAVLAPFSCYPGYRLKRSGLDRLSRDSLSHSQSLSRSGRLSKSSLAERGRVPMRRFILEAPSIIVAILLLMAPGLVPLVAADIKESAVDYNRDVRPILAENCYACHGPDSGAREAGLRLDRQDDATAEYAIGKRAIVPGSPEESVVIARITASDPREVMPPPKSGKALTPEEIDTIRRWIVSAAEWKEPWSYVPPK